MRIYLTLGVAAGVLAGCSQQHQAVEMIDDVNLPAVVAPTPYEPAGASGPLVVMPADGRTTHNPTYYGEVPLRDDAVDPTRIAFPEARLTAALDHAMADNWSLQNWGDAFFAPIEAVGQTVLIPVRQFTGEPLLDTVTTPPTQE